MVTENAFSVSRSMFSVRYASSSSGAALPEAKALLDGTFRHAEARGDDGHRSAGPGELRERDHLVGRVHGDADDILRERELAGVAVRGDLAGHRMIGVERAVLGERLQRGEAASAGDDGEALDAVRVRLVGAGDEVLPTCRLKIYRLRN